MITTCPFCRIISGQRVPKEIIYQDERVLVMLDEDDVIKGHTLVVWKEHVENIGDLSNRQFQYFSKILHSTEVALLKLLAVDKSVILKSGGFVSHFHFHIYPVKKETKWSQIKAMFDKKIHYQYQQNEKQQLVKRLSHELEKKIS